MLFPLLAAYALDECRPRPLRRVADQLPGFVARIEAAI
jgi:hypothetical protein